jgi:hypothetical protein
MIVFFIIFSLIISLVFIVAIRDDFYHDDNHILNIFKQIGGVIGGLVVGGILTMVLTVFGSIFHRGDYTETVTHEIVSMGDGDNINGSFFLGSGYVNDRLVYTYYRKSDNGGMVRRSISASLAVIYETDSLQKPKIVVHIVPSDNGGFWFPINFNSGSQKYDIYLPTGSVIREIKLDNK